MVLRPCLDCGTPTQRTRCLACTTAHESRRLPRRVKGHYDTKHNRLRKLTLREQPWCSRCHSPGTPANPLTADHILPHGRGGLNIRSNYQTLCRACNSAKRDRATPASTA